MHHRLQLVDIDFLDVFFARRPLTPLEADHAADDLDDSLDQQENSGDRNDGLEGVDRRAFGRDVRMLVDRPRFTGVAVASPAEGDNAGYEKQDVEREVERGLQPRRKESVQDIAANMPILR